MNHRSAGIQLSRDLGAQIGTLAERMGVNYRELAQILGVDISTVYRWTTKGRMEFGHARLLTYLLTRTSYGFDVKSTVAVHGGFATLAKLIAPAAPP